VWRAGRVEVLSSHVDGTVRVWSARTKEDALAEEELDEEEMEEEERKGRKRRVLEGIYEDLARKKMVLGGVG